MPAASARLTGMRVMEPPADVPISFGMRRHSCRVILFVFGGKVTMILQTRTRGGARKKRAVVAVQVAVLLIVLIGFAALTVDVGAMYNTRADLQRTADSAALAAAAMLANADGGNPLDLARTAAVSYTGRNAVFGREMTLDTGTDVIFGRATLNAETGQFDFVPTTVAPDAVRVAVRHTRRSVNGSVPLYFASIFGIGSTEMTAEATAVLQPRDIAVVADLSASHNDDSELFGYRNGDVNLLDVWAAVPVERGVNGVGDGVNPPPPGDPLNPAPAPGRGPGFPGDGGRDPGTADTGGQRGPTFGRLYWWGDSLDDTYDPATDPGMIHLPQNQDWSDEDIRVSLRYIGYTPDEVAALMSDSFDGSQDSTGEYGYTNRVAVALGLARWDSGLPRGLWQQVGVDPTDAGNGNNWVGGGELTWLVDWPFNGGSWSDYIYNHVRRENTRSVRSNPDFRYKFGLKTLYNYALDRRSSHADAPDLANTPHQPMQAVKDAVSFLARYVEALDTDDLMSLEIYGTVARHEVDLTPEHVQVWSRLEHMQAGHYDSWTNMGGGLERAIEELTSPRARSASGKMIILLTDGIANVDANGQTGNFPGGAAYALEQAQRASDLGLRIFAVSVGFGADQSLMSQIADIGRGEHFHAEGSIEEYSAQLAEIFRRLGGTRPVELIQ